MRNLNEILKSYENDGLTSGPDPWFTKALDTHKRRLFKTFIIVLIVLILLILLGAYGIWYYLGKGDVKDVAAFTSAIGLAGGSGTLIEILRRTWSEWARTDLIVTLVQNTTQATRDEVIAKLADALFQK